MANVGELVRMENGRWAQYQRCVVCDAGRKDAADMSIVVAVELDEVQQELLNAAEDSLEVYRERGVPVSASFELDGAGRLRIQIDSGLSAVH